MKKALALVLALVLALSMAVSAFALQLKDLTDLTPVEPGKTVITLLDAEDDYVLYVDMKGTYYIGLTDEPWYDVVVTANGCVDAKLVEYDPETMIVTNAKGEDIVEWGVSYKGEEFLDACTYETAHEKAAYFNKEDKVTFYEAYQITNVNVIEITVADNFGVSFLEGNVQIEAKKLVNGVETKFGGEIKVINDVTIFEYEEVKWTANNSKTAALEVGNRGYSDYHTSEHGYSHDFDDYNEVENRRDFGAAVVSTTAFRAIEGKDLVVKVYNGLVVTLKAIAAGQKGVNFLGAINEVYVDVNKNDEFDIDTEKLTAIDVNFYGNQVVKGDYVITVNTGYTWYTLREAFGLKVEEDDIISYYLVDENGNVVGGKEVDYMTADLSKAAAFEIEGSNSTLGNYSLVLEVPAVEGEVEENPNTGAEAVVGVVAALAVVSVATAAAVSLKK